MLNAAEMISVLNISPSTIRIVCARRRGMFRTPMRNITRLRKNTQATLPSATPSRISSATMMSFIGMPKSLFMRGSAPALR